jgi:CubicO group peptidase (beta-lactamase class C family)
MKLPAPFFLSCFLFLLVFHLVTPVLSQPQAMDSVELEAFLDGMIPAFLEAEHIAGATVSVVKNNELFFTKGYGYSDVKAQRPVRPDRTLFRMGSVSKLFVWTAVMQQVEAGHLDLDTDINTYLADFQIPDTYEDPVTLRHLMTHTAGFEDYVLGLFAIEETALRPLGEILAGELPARIRPPGEVSSYSNHGTGMAAYIVEQVSGMPWDEYMETRILEPLGMDHSTFRQPLPASLEDDMAKGYEYKNGMFVERDFEFVPLAPVGAASATATDMARFMMTFLQHGAYGDARILDSTTVELMISPAFQHGPGLNPMRYGFMDYSQNGQTVIGHGGDTFWFHTLFAFLPEKGAGIFLSTNSDQGGAIRGDILEAFLDRYFPGPKLDTLPAADPAELERFTGYYRSNRYSHKRLTKLAAAVNVAKVSATEEGLLETPGSPKRRWIRIDDLRFREVNGETILAFREGDRGRIKYMFVGDLPIIAFERVPWFDRPPLQSGLFGITLIIFILSLIGWPLGYFLRRWYQAPRERQNLLPFPARLLAWLACLCLIVFATGTGLILQEPQKLVFGIPVSMKIMLFFPLIALLLTLSVLAYTAIIWNRRKGRFIGRLYYTLVVLALLANLWQLYHWNLLGFNY